MPHWVNLANLCTLVRLAAVPLIVGAILEARHRTAAAVFAVVAATDSLDGWLARRFHSTSRVGAYLDPIADKVLMVSIYLALAATSSVPVWFVALVFGRDLLIVAACLLALLFTTLRSFPPSPFGKASTFFQIMFAVSVMARNAFGGVLLGGAATALLWVSSAATCVSGIHYAWKGIRMWRDMRR